MEITSKHLKSKQGRKQLFRYWVRDPVFGVTSFALHYFMRFIPMRLNAWLGANIGKLAFKTLLKTKAERARHNLAILKPDLSPQEVDALLDAMWANIGQSMCEYSILDKLWDKGRVHVNDHDAIDYITSGKPFIFTGVHLGNWEAQASYVHAKKIPLMAMYKPPRSRFSRKIAEISRNRMDILTVPTDAQAMRKMYRHLENNGAIWLPIDDFKHNQVHFPRFGRPVTTKGINASHIVRMALRFNAAIVPVQITRTNNPPPSFDVHVHRPMFLQDNSEASIAAFLESIDKLVEGWIMQHPEQWFMMHELRLTAPVDWNPTRH